MLALLRQPDGRPHAAALALARRSELAPEETLTLAEQPGASRRMRRGLGRNLAGRPTGRPVIDEPHQLR
jgi:hypothetical protein